MTRIFRLMAVAASRLEEARRSSDARSSVSLHEGHQCVLRQTVAALASGAFMDIAHPPDEAWLMVLEGRLQIAASSGETAPQTATAGDLIQLPPHAHVVEALDDTVVLLTVAKGERPT